MTEDVLLEEIQDGVATLTLNRPKQLNALTVSLRKQLSDALFRLAENDIIQLSFSWM